MNHRISSHLLSQCSRFVSDTMGLHFPPDRWADLERLLASVTRELGFSDTRAGIEWLLSSPLNKSQFEVLAKQLTIGETYFLRDSNVFAALETSVLPALIQSRRGTDRRLRIWSAGCSTGEEAYSIAILLANLIPVLKDWHITILATDVNPSALKKAKMGAYREWSFRNSPSWLKQKCFRKNEEGLFEILPRIKSLVTFTYLNLVEDFYPSLSNNTTAMDLILCRNVLMYFAPERAHQVVEKIYRALVEGGWLIVSPCETSNVLFSRFEAVNFPGAILYRKDDKASQIHSDLPEPRYWPATEETVPYSLLSDSEAEPQSLDLTVTETPHTNWHLTDEKPVAHASVEDSYQIAIALYEQGFYADAADRLSELFSQGDATSEMSLLLAKAYANQGRLTEALRQCDQALTVDKLNANLHYLRATILQEQSEPDEAVKALNRALYLDPNFVLAHFALGNLCLRREKLKQARKHFANALSLLSDYQSETSLSEAEGLTAGRLREIILSIKQIGLS